MSEPTNPATLFIRRLQEDASRTGTEWTEFGKLISPPVFRPGPEALEAFREIGTKMHEAMMQLGKGFTQIAIAPMSSVQRELMRLFLNVDLLLCTTCRRRFRGVWQRRKHERTAHA